ncbi:hypothetical protein ARTHROSP310_05530 [Arthrobacter sp. AD-310]
MMRELPGPPNWLNPNCPNTSKRLNWNSRVAVSAAPSDAQCPAERTAGTPAGSNAENPVEQTHPVSAM